MNEPPNSRTFSTGDNLATGERMKGVRDKEIAESRKSILPLDKQESQPKTVNFPFLFDFLLSM